MLFFTGTFDFDGLLKDQLSEENREVILFKILNLS